MRRQTKAITVAIEDAPHKFDGRLRPGELQVFVDRLVIAREDGELWQVSFDEIHRAVDPRWRG